MMYVDILKANIDFPSNDTIRITTPYRQKTFKVSGVSYFDLEKLVEVKPAKGKLPTMDFWLEVRKHSQPEKLSKQFYYSAWATTGAHDKDEIGSFDHNEPIRLEVKINRYKK